MLCLLGYLFIPRTSDISQLSDNWYDEQGLKGLNPHPPSKIPSKYLKNTLDEYSAEYVIDEEDAGNDGDKVRAAFVILAQNDNLQGIRLSMRQMEDRFNRKFGYPYVFLSHEELSDEFKERVTDLTKAKVLFGKIEPDMWGYPAYINQTYAAECRDEMEKKKPTSGVSEVHQHMSRFQSGYFFRHPLLDDFEYYWRIDPTIEYFCDIDYDVFQMMKDNDYKYGWTMSLTEYPESFGTLWEVVLEFMKKYPHYINMEKKNSLASWLTDDDFLNYNGCQFYSNFEIGSLAFFRSERYIKFFDYIDNAGGFFYERWADAPVHSIALALMLKETDIHFFNDIGYKSEPLMHCPTENYLQKKCNCNSDDSFDWHNWSCLTRYRTLHSNFIWDEETYDRKTKPYSIH
ncbi:glycosyltransferase family 15 protein [Backusella circina FSU 941]|nr:glycosyltransferase family 15 protein [Backusella circina FSU 941]